MTSIPPNFAWLKLAPGPSAQTRAVLLAVACALLLAGCATPVAIRDSRALWSEGRIEDAVSRLQDAAAKAPGDFELRAAYLRQRDLGLNQLVSAADAARAARRFDEAEALYARAARIDATDARIRGGRRAIESTRRHDQVVADALAAADQGETAAAELRLRGVLAEDAAHGGARRALQKLRARQAQADALPPQLKGALDTPVTLDFRDTPLRSVFDVLARAAGLNFVFDRDVRTDTRITIMVRGSPVEDALRLILTTNGLERKVLNDNSVLIYPNTQVKAREYQDLMVRTFYLVNGDAKQAQALLRAMVRSRDIFIDERLNMVTVRDTPDAIRLAERLIETIDIGDAEVMLDLEVVEISRTRAQELGVTFPTELFRESTAPSAAGRAVLGSTSLVTTITNPVLRLALTAQDGNANLLANPRIRARNREKAKVLIGEKLPVFTTTAVQNAGVASSVSYLDVGLKLEVEPQVTLDDEVAIKVLLEVNSNLGAVVSGTASTGTTTGYRIGTRSAQTTLRLHDGETQVLAGLINDNERDTITKIPGLGDVPALGRLFSNSNSSKEKTEIILLITPHVLRNVVPPDLDALFVPAGTELSAGARPLTIAPTGPRTLALNAGGSGGGASGLPGRSPPAGRIGRGGALPAPPPPPEESDSDIDAGNAAVAAAAAAAAAALQAGAPTAAPTAAAQSAAAAAPGAAAPGAARIGLRAPEQVSLGRDFNVQVDVSGAGGATEGDVVLSLGSAFQGGAGNGRVTVHVTGGGGALGGAVTLRAVTAGTGSASIDATEGRIKLPDGTTQAIPAGASVSVRIGL